MIETHCHAANPADLPDTQEPAGRRARADYFQR